MDIQKIKELALANGFKLKEQADGSMDLNAYVYDFANSIEQAAKAQAVPEAISIGNELQSWVAVNSFSADDGEGVLPVVDANAIAEKIEELTGANQ